MNKPHKHAEVLRAIADGKEVQWANPETCDGCWHDLDVDLFNPLANSVLRWRVKPEPKPDVVKYLTVSKFMGLTHQDLSSNAVAIFCGETGRLKSLEII